MTRPAPMSMPAGPARALGDFLRLEFGRADRVALALAGDPGWLIELLGGTAGATRVQIVLPRHRRLPPHWEPIVVSRLPAPELALFYRPGCSFPESALVFSGPAGPEAWATVHRRPLVLDTLQRRFLELAGRRTDGRSVRPVRRLRRSAAIRETGREQPTAGSSELADLQEVSARAAYRRILAEHFVGVPTLDPSDDPTAGPALAAHQLRAYERARAILERYGGVIVADSVGLGKTHVGLRLIEWTVQAYGRAVIVVPAALRRDWKRHISYLQSSDAPASQRKSDASDPGTGDNLELWLHDRPAPHLALVSMEAMGRRTFDPAPYRGAELVLVDEAHHFRNPQTRRYRVLASLTRHARVVLLTATPINNSLFDLQHLIDLFAAPGAFRHLGISDYRSRFREAATSPDVDVGPIVSACVVRRTRHFLRQHYGEVQLSGHGDRTTTLAFPRREPPVPVRYDLAGTYGEILERLETWIDALHFAELRPDDGGNSAGGSTAALLKVILLKRLESSIEAFKSTVLQQLAWADTVLRAAASNRVLTRPDYRSIFKGPADDPAAQLTFVELMLPASAADPQRMAELQRSLRSDRDLLARMHKQLAGMAPDADMKLGRLLELLDGPLAGRKVLIFTEFRDTARYIHRRLRERPHVGLIDSGRARLGRSRARRSEVIERFAPLSNGRSPPPQHERVQTLIATDVLSEGLNLQDASTVVSYDLPWNPVRLMQRMGRIDRLGSRVERVWLYHFVPAHDLDRLLGLMDRLAAKLGTIIHTLGLDQPILAPPSLRPALIEAVRGAATGQGLESLEREVEGPMDPDERAYLDLVTYNDGRSDTDRPARPGAEADEGPLVAAVSGEPARVVAYWRLDCGDLSRSLWLVSDPTTGYVVEDQVGALDTLRHASDRQQIEVPTASVETARRRFLTYARAIAAQLDAAHAAGDALRPYMPQCRIAAWLADNFRRSVTGLDRDERARIDRLISGLARRFTRAEERTLRRLADHLPPVIEESFLERLERALAAAGPGAEESRHVSLREVATLAVVAPSGRH